MQALHLTDLVCSTHLIFPADFCPLLAQPAPLSTDFTVMPSLQ